MFVKFIKKKNRTENVKILLLQNNCINNGVTNDQNNRNKKSM